MTQNTCPRCEALDALAAERRARSEVYYLERRDGRIKIGYSTDRASRQKKLEREARQSLRLLCAHPGGRPAEAAKHRQFAHLRIGRSEWFEPGRDLLDHIAFVQRRHGQHGPRPLAAKLPAPEQRFEDEVDPGRVLPELERRRRAEAARQAAQSRDIYLAAKAALPFGSPIDRMDWLLRTGAQLALAEAPSS